MKRETKSKERRSDFQKGYIARRNKMAILLPKALQQFGYQVSYDQHSQKHL